MLHTNRLTLRQAVPLIRLQIRPEMPGQETIDQNEQCPQLMDTTMDILLHTQVVEKPTSSYNQ